MTHRDRGRSDLFIYLRIFVILGITWIFGILVLFAPDGSTIEEVLILCYVITDSLQGFFLFWIFTFNSLHLDIVGVQAGPLRHLQQVEAVTEVGEEEHRDGHWKEEED